MKMGMRKPSVKKSFSARSTGKAKRAVKKAVVPGYGKKGSGWIKDPKKAAYNKVYNKTTFSVNDVMHSASGHSSKKTPTKVSASATAAPSVNVGSKISYNVLVKKKPSINVPIIFAILGLIILLVFRILGILILLYSIYQLYDYKHRSKTKDYISENQLTEWINTAKKYSDSLPDNIKYFKLLECSKSILSNQYRILLQYYNMNDAGENLTQKNKIDLINSSNIVIDFENYITYKTSDVRFLPDRIQARRTDTIHSYIDAEYSKWTTHAQTLKTEQGKLNQIEKYKENVVAALSDVSSDFSDYMTDKINQKDFI